MACFERDCGVAPFPDSQLKLQLRRDSNEIQMRKMLVAKLCGAKAEFTTLTDLAMAHRVVFGLESIPKRIG
jgi:hypothetical protein